MTPITVPRSQSGTHIAERMCWIRIDCPMSKRSSFCASEVRNATFCRTTMSTIVREKGTSPSAAAVTFDDLTRATRVLRSPVSSISRRKPRSTGRYSKIRSMTFSRTVSSSSAEIRVLATWTRISKTLFL
jgi:hypothetical protein